MEVTEAKKDDTPAILDDDLADILMENTTRLVAGHPELVPQVAESLGWKVSPPAGGPGEN
jgi:hypothetical protein